MNKTGLQNDWKEKVEVANNTSLLFRELKEILYQVGDPELEARGLEIVRVLQQGKSDSTIISEKEINSNEK